MVEEQKEDLEQLVQSQRNIERILMQRVNQNTNIVSTNDSIRTSDVSDDWQSVHLTTSSDEDAPTSIMGGPLRSPIPRTSSQDLNGSFLQAVSLPPVGPTLKSLITEKILIHDYSGILDDLKTFDRKVPSNAKELKQILYAIFKELRNDASKIAQLAPTYQFDMMTTLASPALINDLHAISERSILFMAYVSDTQKSVIGIRLEIVTIINETTSLICEECKSSLNGLQLSSVNFNFLEAEGVIKSAELKLLLLEKLADEMINDRKAQEPLITQVKFS